MHVLVGWPPPIRYGRQLASRVMNLCASLRGKGQLDGVLVTLPPADDERSRSRVFALLESLGTAGVTAAGVLVSLPSGCAADLDECLDAGVRDFVFLEESASPREALRILDGSRLPRVADARVRVWLTASSQGSYQSHMAAWQSVCDFAVELAPAPFDAASGVADVAPARSTPAATLSGCDWRAAVVTVVGDGSILPCPDHRAIGGPAISARDPEVVLGQLGEWRHALAGSPLCGRCDRQVRFGIQDWLGCRQMPGQPVAPDDPHYHDYIGRDASDAPDAERDALIDDFARRIGGARDPRDLP